MCTPLDYPHGHALVSGWGGCVIPSPMEPYLTERMPNCSTNYAEFI